MFTKATNYINKLIEEKKLPLLDVLVKRGHEEIYRHYGSYTGEFGKDEKLCMFSCTKVLTAVSGMKLLEEGKIFLDDPVAKYIPAFSEAFTLDENGNKHTEVITVRNLFTMSSGFEYNRMTPEVVKLAEESYDTATTTDVVSEFVKRPLNFKPGERFLYSLSHDALGAVIETVSGMNLAEYMQRYILTPLGMENSTMYYEKYAENLPIVHKITENGFESDGGKTYGTRNPVKNYRNGGSHLISTVSDYSVFADTLASGGITKDGYRLIKSETIEKMKEVHFNAVNVNNTFTCVQGTDYGYGLGVRVRTVPHPSGIPVGEFGWDGAAGSYVLVDTDNKISVTMGMNILNWPKIFKGEHLEIVSRIYEELI